jgi:hypothetical protein
MRKHVHRFFTLVFAFACILLLRSAAIAAEPQRPDVNRQPSAKHQQVIGKLSKYSPGDAFEELKGPEFLADEELMNKAVFETFKKRREEGIDLALRKLSLPVKEFDSGGKGHRARDLYVAKKIVEVFPDESAPALLNLYESGDATTKGNIIRASGKLAGEAARHLLIRALSDKTFCDPADPEVDGPPMRICDLAYNQLVLRYRIKNVLRTIGPIDRIETRDLHITNLKWKL